MLISIIRSQLCIESCIHKSYRTDIKKFIYTGQRYLHQKSPLDNDRSIERTRPENQTYSSQWKGFWYPSTAKLYKFDNIKPDEWTLVYRLKWSTKLLYSIVYMQFALLTSLIVVLHKVFIKKEKIHKAPVEDEDYFRIILVGISLMICGLAFLIIRSFSKVVLRGYYSQKYQRFLFIRPTLMQPWQIRKVICAPGLLEPIPESSSMLIEPNFKIKDTKILLFENNFFYPTYFNVLSGFTGSHSIENIRFDPDSLFWQSMKKSSRD
ncbi:uncharacterized protein LOC107366685 [Tetranychus urticae]|uniref:Uncharacterized protein n=1 Tax=Tetranychus urticae TaxID=32264 RepID=T1KSF8_TETUR|nr:uncharacterized protein LOC107366685 [Tetranychus urticae]